MLNFSLGRRHDVLFGRDRYHRHPSLPSQNLVFPQISDHFILKVLENENFHESRRRYLNTIISGGRPPLIIRLSTTGDAYSPSPPAFDAHDYI